MHTQNTTTAQQPTSYEQGIANYFKCLHCPKHDQAHQWHRCTKGQYAGYLDSTTPHTFELDAITCCEVA
jgi:hypothetical protein